MESKTKASRAAGNSMAPKLTLSSLTQPRSLNALPPGSVAQPDTPTAILRDDDTQVRKIPATTNGEDPPEATAVTTSTTFLALVPFLPIAYGDYHKWQGCSDWYPFLVEVCIDLVIHCFIVRLMRFFGFLDDSLSLRQYLRQSAVIIVVSLVGLYIYYSRGAQPFWTPVC
ncbi:hypothetical protein IWZ00DRAFT_267800 [Phyllosticta capitalensis]